MLKVSHEERQKITNLAKDWVRKRRNCRMQVDLGENAVLMSGFLFVLYSGWIITSSVVVADMPNPNASNYPEQPSGFCMLVNIWTDFICHYLYWVFQCRGCQWPRYICLLWCKGRWKRICSIICQLVSTAYRKVTEMNSSLK